MVTLLDRSDVIRRKSMRYTAATAAPVDIGGSEERSFLMLLLLAAVASAVIAAACSSEHELAYPC